MGTKYVESEKVWRSPVPVIKMCGLGEAILDKLKESDPKRVLEIHHDSGTQLTVDEIRHQTITVAQNMIGLGVKTGDHIILYSRSNTKITPITFACFTIGAPLNFFETNFEGEAISYNLGILDPTVIIYEKEFKKDVFDSLEKLKLSKLKHLICIDSETNSADDILFKPAGDIENFKPPNIGDPTTLPATLMFTSGSTEMPKIVKLSHAIMLQGLCKEGWKLGSEHVICTFCDLRWIIQTEFMMQPVFLGVKRVYTSKAEFQLSVEEKRHIFDKYKVTFTCEVPMYFLSILADAEKSYDSNSLSSLRVVLLAGEVVPDSLVTYSAKIVPLCRTIKCYGMSEMAGAVASNFLMSSNDVNGGVLRNGLIVKIIDHNGVTMGPNEIGLLCLKFAYPFLGYLGNEEANKKAFLDGGWYDTGDAAYFDSNNILHVVARFDNLLRFAGNIIIPSSVENIVNSHPNVLTSALVSQSDPKNPSDKVGCLFAVPLNNSTSGNIEAELRNFIKSKLTKEQLHGIRYLQVMPDMPLTTCGKADKKVLKKLAAENCSFSNYLI